MPETQSFGESPWYELYFEERYLRAYGPLLATVDVPAEVDSVVRELQIAPGARILDLCCGQGRHAVELARRGFRVTGLDLSDHLLGRAREKARESGVQLELVRGDMREIPWTGEFDAAINMFTAFGYFEDDRENHRVLEGVARSLLPGGRFYLDTASFTWLLRHWETLAWTPGEGGLLQLQDRRMDWLRGIQRTQHLFVEPDGSRQALATNLRLYLPHELASLLRSAGLEVEKLLGDRAGGEFGMDSSRLILVAMKPA